MRTHASTIKFNLINAILLLFKCVYIFIYVQFHIMKNGFVIEIELIA